MLSWNCQSGMPSLNRSAYLPPDTAPARRRVKTLLIGT